MLIRDIMIKEVLTVEPDETTAKAAALMRERAVLCLVIAAGETPKGILTDRDLLGCISAAHNPHHCRVSAHMTRPVIVERPDEDLMTATRVMGQRRIKRLPIVEGGRLVGIVSLSDVVRATENEASRFLTSWLAVMSVADAETKVSKAYQERKVFDLRQTA